MSIKTMVLHSGFKPGMMHCSENGFVFTDRFKNFVRFEKVFKTEDHKAWDGSTCLKKRRIMKTMDFF